ncbi:MAG: hybrid sensor histidine kinase/response regulator [Ignavibacteriaceae bacterium]|nr:hybrid sensor histidine kinase/response regulator [Ignavibacteriaceae bacterium]
MEQIKVNSYYNLSNTKMLVIDDDESLSKSIKYFFEDLNCLVTTAKSGEEGLEKFKLINPEIVLVDLNMPGMGGHGVISHISRNYPDVPIVVVSGTGIIKEAIRSMNLGAWEYVSKPILHFEELEMSVLRALEKAFLIKENKTYKQDLEKLVRKRTRQLFETISELEVAKKELEQANTLKNEFLGQISHEIRTPLNAILSYLDLISMEIDFESSELLKNGFEAINKGSRRLIRTIELIIRMSELITRNYTLEPVEVNVHDLIKEALIQLSHIYPNRITELVCEDKSVNIKIDEYSLLQILLNTIDNAYKFSGNKPIKISVTKNVQGHLLLEIEDRGVGMSSEFINTRLFSPFSQEHTGYTRDYEGNGLGMALTKGYCDLNNVLIFVNSEKEKGTRIQFVFNGTEKKVEEVSEQEVENFVQKNKNLNQKTY